MSERYNKSLTGFTIIELLVVIGIIGILVAIVAVSFVYVRNNARDGRVAGEMDQLRKAVYAEVNNRAGSYDNINCLVGSLTPLCDSVEEISGNNLIISSNSSSWCAEVELHSGDTHCVDVAGTAIKGYECSSGDPYVCVAP